MEYGQCPGRFQARSRACSPTFEAWTIPHFTFPNKLWVSFRPSLNTVLYLKFVFTVPLFHTWITALSRSLWTYWLLRQLFHFPLRKKLKSLIRVWLFATPWTVAHQAPSMEFSRQSTGVCCHFLLQEIFLTQGSTPGLLHCRQTLYCLRQQGSATISGIAWDLDKFLIDGGHCLGSRKCNTNVATEQRTQDSH